MRSRFVLALTILVALSGNAYGDERYVPMADAKRGEVPEKFKWNLGVLFRDVADWEKTAGEVSTRISSLAMCKGKLGQEARTTLQCLDDFDTLKKDVEVLNAFAFQSWSVAMEDSQAQALKDKGIALAAKLAETASFFDPEMQEIPQAKWDSMVKEQPGLLKYSFKFKDLKRRRQHLLSPKEEALIAMTLPMREGPYNTMNALTQEMDFPVLKDEKGEEVKLGPASFPKYRASLDRRVRKDAVTGYFSTLRRYQNTLASSLATSVKGAVFEAKARGYKSSLEMMLDADNVSVDVYDNLLAVTRANLPKTLHRYVALRKKILGYSEIHYYDMYNPLFPEVKKEIPYTEAVRLVRDAMKPMGQEYVAILSSGMEPGSGWVDVYPNKGKKGGAYCNGVYGFHPFVLLNYMNELDDVFTLAHEFGHAMHFYIAQQAQPHPTAEASIFLAEIASTFQEEMLLHHLLKQNPSEPEKLALLNKRIENIRLTITRQTMFAEFEKKIHAEVESGGALTAERLNTIYRELVEAYFGPHFSIDENDELEWAYIPHFYYNFYVYKYSTGLMAAIVFSQRIQEGRPGATQQFRAFLAAGGSDYPLNILKKSGIDFSKPEIVQSTYDLFARTLDEIEALMK